MPSASHRRTPFTPFAYAFTSWTRYNKRGAISHQYMSSSTLSVGTKVVEINQYKRRRREDKPTKTTMNYSTTEEDLLQSRSLYERKMGKMISICSKCNGEGKVRSQLSKKARARRKQMQQNISGESAPQNPPMKPCRTCDGSGLVVAISPTFQANNEKEQDMNSKISVAIVGGGIGGIALAAALQHRNIPCVVYERDNSFDERKQGYGLTMQQGARALRSLGFFSLIDADNSNTQFGVHSKRHVVHKPDGTVVGEWGMKVWGGRFEKNGRKHAKRQNAHISRQNLRKLLMEMLIPDTVKWGHKFICYSERSSESKGTENSHLALKFRRRTVKSEGMEEECDEEVLANATILVGCDGIRSAVRAKKLGEDVSPLRYLGCIVILGIAVSPESSLTDGETVFQTADGLTRLYAMPFAQPGQSSAVMGDTIGHQSNNDRGLSMWQLSFPIDEADALRLSQLGPSALKAEALNRCGDWHDPIPQLLSQTPEHLITGYPCYDRALVDKDIFREGSCKASDTAAGNSFVTMLGDAAHPMSPFKGEHFLLSFSILCEHVGPSQNHLLLHVQDKARIRLC